MDGRVRACFPEMPPIAGYAATATMRCAFPKLEGDVYTALDEQVVRFAELPGPPIVVYQDLDDPAWRRPSERSCARRTRRSARRA